MKLTNKLFQEEDLQEIFILTKENMQELFIENFGGWSDEVCKNKLKEISSKGTLQLFFKENQFIGYVSYHQEENNPQSILINDIHIKKEFQQQGYGTTILQWVKSQITNHTQLKVFVFKNNPAHIFYEKNNFKKQPQEKNHTYIMTKQL